MAREVLGVEPIEVDRRGESIAAMVTEDLIAYAGSDTDITLRLAETLQRLPVNAGRPAQVAQTA